MRHSNLSNIENSEKKCQICYQRYNRFDRSPWIVCQNHHTVCKDCLQNIAASQKCPFCRQIIDFRKIALNDKIFVHLPNIPPPNTRIQLYQPLRHTYQNINLLEQLNDHPFSQQQRYQNVAEIDNEFLRQDQNRSCLSKLYRELRLQSQPFRKCIYFFTIIFQIPYIFFDLYFSITSTEIVCMDISYKDHFKLRSWLYCMGIIQAHFAGVMLASILLKLNNLITLGMLQICEGIIMVLCGIKFIFWMIFELVLFYSVIHPHCNGGFYAYSVVQTVFHSAIILILMLISSCNR